MHERKSRWYSGLQESAKNEYEDKDRTPEQAEYIAGAVVGNVAREREGKRVRKGIKVKERAHRRHSKTARFRKGTKEAKAFMASIRKTRHKKVRTVEEEISEASKKEKVAKAAEDFRKRFRSQKTKGAK